MSDYIYPYIHITRIQDLPEAEFGTSLIGHYAFIYLDFTSVPEYAAQNRITDCLFFGCTFPEGFQDRLERCLVFPRMGMDYHAWISDLYSAQSLYQGFVPGKRETFAQCFDQRVYRQYLEQGVHSEDIRVMLSRQMHDHSIYDAMKDFLLTWGQLTDVIGIMGGHGLKRGSREFWDIVHISKELTEKGKLMVSGGGPGAMEATHLGAWMAGREWNEVADALVILTKAGEDDNYEWLSSAFAVRRKYPQERYVSLAIPTWLYGHEPSTPLATHIAKYFTNSIREDMILSVTLGGIIITPGAAGTMQEIFQNAAKLHYDEKEKSGPMYFLGRDFFTREVPVYPFLKDLQERKKYAHLKLRITDSAQEIIDRLTE